MNASSPQEFLGKAWMNACRSGQQRLASGGVDQAAEHGDDLGGAFMHKRHAAQRAVLVVMQGMSGTDAVPWKGHVAAKVSALDQIGIRRNRSDLCHGRIDKGGRRDLGQVDRVCTGAEMLLCKSFAVACRHGSERDAIGGIAY